MPAKLGLAMRRQFPKCASPRWAGLADGVVEDVRIALGSVAPVPLRLTADRASRVRRVIDSALLLLAKKTAMAEVRPIDDIRSTARYRAAVAGNLVVEFLNRLESDRAIRARTVRTMLWRDGIIFPPTKLREQFFPAADRPLGHSGWLPADRFADESALSWRQSNEIWRNLTHSDWMEAFQSHPRIGESRVSSLRR